MGPVDEYVTTISQDRRTVYACVLNMNGFESQVGMVMEESGELLAALNHYQRRRENSENELLEEIADMTIMLEQLVVALSLENGVEYEPLVQNIMKTKIHRLKKRLGMPD